MSGARLLDHWSPPDGAGAAVACLATTFTFEADFVAQDCLSRFLSLSSVVGEGDRITSIAALLEEEDRLSEAQVSVLVDRSSPAEKRNLRWDVLPVAVPTGLLHAKVAVLLWERSTRIVLGSANLTSAGYRRQVEVALAIDLDEVCGVPRKVLDDIVAELRELVELVPGEAIGPKERAMKTLDLLEARVEAADLPASSRELRLAVAPARPGVTPLEQLPQVWRGAQPLRATWLSPFWDDAARPPAIDAVRRLLTGRPASQRGVTLIAEVDPFTGSVNAPPSLRASGVHIVAFDPPDEERRSLHAKLLLVESDEWLAALIGSSNATAAGLGLHPANGHRELNLWLGCPAGSRTAKHLRSLARAGEAIDSGDERWEPLPDEDEPSTPELPLGFVTCTLDASQPPRLTLTFAPTRLPAGRWEVRTPAGSLLLTADAWSASGAPPSVSIELPAEPLPAYLVVRWADGPDQVQATWVANVGDRSSLPPPAELAELPVEVLLAALASTRPLPVALEHELRRRERVGAEPGVDLDPLRRFDDSSLLLHRVRHVSLALWRLQERLARPTTSTDALRWRFFGALGPVAIADGLVNAAHGDGAIPGEAHFLLAELALTIAGVDWHQVGAGIDRAVLQDLVTGAVTAIADRYCALPPAPDPQLGAYVRDALKAAAR
jgi:hypothetical protein